MSITQNAADIAALNATIASLRAELSANYLTTADANSFFLLICGAFVFFMQTGFALLEAGTVRAKNAKNILMKNLLDACIGAIIWWAWGHGIAYDGGGNEFIGHPSDLAPNSFFVMDYNRGDSGTAYTTWWFQFTFAAASATIVSGAMAERTTLFGYLVYTFCISGLIYPVIVYWTWSGHGWVSKWNGGLLDFAGSGIVHMTGGISAIVGASVVGPRRGRFQDTGKCLPIAPHNSTYCVLGTFILWVGWYGFNPGSTLRLSGKGDPMGLSIITSTLSASAGALTVLVVKKLTTHVWDVGMLCNGILAGLVSTTAGCANVHPWAALIIGFIGAFIYMGASNLVVNRCKVDDPLDAFAVHGCCGCWGIHAAALFAAPEFGRTGLFYGDGAPLVVAFCFTLANIAWTGGLSCMMFIPLKLMGLLRVSPEMEDAGMDVSKHGGRAYDF
ncbi:hypothetical protein AB1Y20_019751 [Prymnesium parvum]|uniref:Ammonium transporter n=1 Tax=Prymnesium parvum TaxID=97485 RepID=A0AB34JRZ8_PRYPA